MLTPSVDETSWNEQCGFGVIYQQLIKYFSFVRCWTKNESMWYSTSIIYRFQEDL